MIEQDSPLNLDLVFNHAAAEAVNLGNQLADADQQADLREIADGMLAGVIQYWLYSHQPCEDTMCADCAPISTAELRLAELMKAVERYARESEYYHSPSDSNVGRA